MANMTGNAAFAKLLLRALIPVIDEALSKGTLESVKQLENSTCYSVMTSGPNKNMEQVKKMQYMLPNLK